MTMLEAATIPQREYDLLMTLLAEVEEFVSGDHAYENAQFDRMAAALTTLNTWYEQRNAFVAELDKRLLELQKD
jgi:hypothetical protein